MLLRPYQERSLDELRSGIASGHRCQILMAGTGSGKTVMGAHLMQAAQAKGKRAAFIVDRIPLIEQASRTFDAFGIDHGIIQAGHWRWRPHATAQICSAQTLARRGFQPFDLAIVDECFLAGTEIATPSGPRPIELVRSGDLVYNAIGVGVVLGTSVKPAKKRRIVTVRLDDGTEIRCTEEHKFFTTESWVPARMLAGKSLIGIEAMPGLWRDHEADGQAERQGKLAGLFGKDVARSKNLLEVLLEEAEKPNALGRVSPKNGEYPNKDRSSSGTARRKREAIYQSAIGVIAKAWRGLGGGVYFQDKNEELGRVSSSLQAGRGKSRKENSDRGGRGEPRHNQEETARREERRAFSVARVVSVQVEERESDHAVYNLHISGHPSYFAGGALVHNCHTCYKATTEYVQRSGAIVVGLTATPFTKGLGKIYSRVVNVVSTNQLVNEGWLVPLKMFAAKEIDMTGAKLNSKGEWDEREIEQRGHKIVGDIVTEWVAKTHQYFSGPAKTIVFSATVDHGRDLCGQFNAAGYRFEQISYRDSDERRAELIREFSKADSDIVGLISCEALAKGFDVPDIRIGVCARPYRKSLSGHIQQLGRVMRPHPGKDFALWLDHAGNLLRFMEDTEEVFENGVSELDDGKLDSAVRKEKTDTEKKQIVCSCGFFLSPHMTSCPACGKERIRLSLVVSAPGEMQEVGAKKANRQFSTAEKRAFYAQLVHYAIHKNYKPGWPANKYRERFGVWPNAHKNVSPMIPDPKTLAWIRHSAIKWAKGRAA